MYVRKCICIWRRKTAKPRVKYINVYTHVSNYIYIDTQGVAILHRETFDLMTSSTSFLYGHACGTMQQGNQYNKKGKIGRRCLAQNPPKFRHTGPNE